MYPLLSIGYSLLSVVTVFSIICGSSNSMGGFYKIFLSAEEGVREFGTLPQVEEFDKGVWELDFPEIEELLPDLRQEVVFLGSNDRPDALKSKFSLALASSGDRYTAAPGEKVYLCTEPSSQGVMYTFSTSPTELWLECRSVGIEGRIEVKVRLIGTTKTMISSPKERETLFLGASMRAISSWEIGGIKVDASFPVKQKMRRVGLDKFLLMHGGVEYADKAVKERIDFTSASEENYSRYLSVGDFLLWDGEFWQSCGAFRGESASVPLLEVKKIDDKVIVIDLWNVGGTARQSVSLAKTLSSPIEITDVLRELEFVGMRSWSRPIVLLGKQRLILSPNDWVLRTITGWEKLSSPQQIQDYVSGKLSGPLMVFEKLEKEGANFVLRGHVFNSQRTLVETITLPLKQGLESSLVSHEQTSSSCVVETTNKGSTIDRGGA
ncbi:hypothetical protein [Chlamydia sp. 17-3921]|uniref:hypothetical protein n=1 Tax=Chlamydia sp. 17-3921 TaxID=2675798 RepID=UPI00191B31D3|nr:hypothetical protein [Chlamydia sp. 17-3921]